MHRAHSAVSVFRAFTFSHSWFLVYAMAMLTLMPAYQFIMVVKFDLIVSLIECGTDVWFFKILGSLSLKGNACS